MMHSYAAMLQRSKADRETMDRVNRIQYEVGTHVGTTLLTFDDLPAPYEFVMEKFPEVADLVKGVKLYKNDNTALWARLGLSGAAGLYIRPLSVVFIMYSPKVPDDIVAVHELLHCAHDKLHLAKDVYAQETMTFRASIPYIAKRYDENWMVENYLFPFYYGVYLNCQQNGLCIDNPKQYARDKCRQIVREETGTAAVVETDGGGPDRFDFLD
jgi:hypothetical protein